MTPPTDDGTPPTDTEEAFLRDYDATAFPPLAVTVDLVVLTVHQDRLCVLLVRRTEHPHRGRWALPGRFVGPRQGLLDAARTTLQHETGLAPERVHLEQLRSYGDPDRDPRMRVVSVAYLAVAPDLPHPDPGPDAGEARFWAVADLGSGILAFDHDLVLTDGLERARSKLEYTSLATTFLEQPFTIGDLRRVYETVWGHPLHPANFRRKVLSTPGFVHPVGAEQSTGRGHAELYRAGEVTALHPPLLRHALPQLPRSPRP